MLLFCNKGTTLITGQARMFCFTYDKCFKRWDTHFFSGLFLKMELSSFCIKQNGALYIYTWGPGGSVVVKALRYKSVGLGIDSKRRRLEFILWGRLSL